MCEPGQEDLLQPLNSAAPSPRGAPASLAMQSFLVLRWQLGVALRREGMSYWGLDGEGA